MSASNLHMPSEKTRVDQTVRADVLKTAAYHVADATGMLKLDAMENPYTLPEAMVTELGQRLAQATLNRYPVPHSHSLEKALRSSLTGNSAIPKDAQVVFGNGSDELISLIIQALCQPGDVVLSPVPTFVMYGVSAQWAHAQFVGVPLQADFTLDMPAMLQAIKTHQPKVIFLAYPNNPTGNAFSADDIQTIANASQGMVVVDEAYEPFAAHSFMSRVLDFPNMVVLRTLSKLGLAGIRLGYLAGHPQWLGQIDKIRPPYNINVLTRTTAEYVLENSHILKQQAEQLKQERVRLSLSLSDLEGVKVYVSDANFVLFGCKNAINVFEALKNRGILIKNVSGMHRLLNDCLRVTVSSPEENQQFLDNLRQVLAMAVAK